MKFDKYRNTKELPGYFDYKKPIQHLSYVIDKLEGIIKYDGFSGELHNIAVRDCQALKTDRDALKKKKNDLQREYNEEGAVLLYNFKNDLFEELGITNNPKREELWKKVEEFMVEEDSNSYENMYDYACTIVDLIK